MCYKCNLTESRTGVVKVPVVIMFIAGLICATFCDCVFRCRGFLFEELDVLVSCGAFHQFFLLLVLRDAATDYYRC